LNFLSFVMIVGFIVQGDAPRTVLVTARGPSVGVLPEEQSLLLADPSVQFYAGAQVIYENVDWQSRTN